MYGISKRSYPDVDIARLTTGQAMTIYRRDYWDALDLGQVSNSIISGEIFDTAVNMGRKRAVVIAQKALNFLGEDLIEDGINLIEDGIIGQKTIQALNKWGQKDDQALFVCLNGFQFFHYKRISERSSRLRKFSRGWTKRIQQYQRIEEGVKRQWI
jgi:lysozyme family protein